LFGGGDVAGNGTTVEAVNDGKTASWNIHKFIQESHGLTVPSTPQLPLVSRNNNKKRTSFN
jgi:dihydropyrimidine dehydrogenase (NADP+)